MSTVDKLTGAIIAAAIEVHKQLGPGLLESVYETCLIHELKLRGLNVASQVGIPIVYKGAHLNGRLVLDLLIEDQIIVEIKAVDNNHDIHAAQLLTYLRLSGHRFGLVLNFGKATLTEGIQRIVNGY